MGILSCGAGAGWCGRAVVKGVFNAWVCRNRDVVRDEKGLFRGVRSEECRGQRRSTGGPALRTIEGCVRGQGGFAV